MTSCAQLCQWECVVRSELIAAAYLGPEMGNQGVMTPAGLVPAYDQQPYGHEGGLGRVYLYGQDTSNSYMDQNYGHTTENIQGTAMLQHVCLNT